jgi:hypothetical protein
LIASFEAMEAMEAMFPGAEGILQNVFQPEIGGIFWPHTSNIQHHFEKT